MNDGQDEALDVVPEATQTARARSPPAVGLRQRALGRATTFAETAPQSARRSSSFMSETLSESRRSFKSSTDNLFLPRASNNEDIHAESSHWHSLPLGLALLPAVGGLFFQNGSAFITDISLLGLAALFLNWAVRLPWEWYHSAQAVTTEGETEPEPQALDSAIDDEDFEASASQTTAPSKSASSPYQSSTRGQSAASELRIHELLALSACFIFPALGAWLLHAIRIQLSRPSEGLVSDYNLTIFLLASEVRPLSHLIKLVQRRTLFLQRTVSASAEAKHITESAEFGVIAEMTQRLADLEAHVTGSVLLPTSSLPASPSGGEAGNGSISLKSAQSSTQPATIDDIVKHASNQASTEVKRTLQPDLDALNRAMRRYEKRSTVAAVQVETRLQDLEAKIQDVVILAAATQRNADRKHGKYTPILLNWISMVIVVPVQWSIWTLGLPGRMLAAFIERVKTRLGFARKDVKNGTVIGTAQSGRQRTREKKGKSVT